MNNKAITPLTVIVWYMVALLMFIFVFAPMLNQIGEDAVESGSAVGLEAFFYANFNMFIFLFSLIGLVAMMYFVGGGSP